MGVDARRRVGVARGAARAMTVALVVVVVARAVALVDARAAPRASNGLRLGTHVDDGFVVDGAPRGVAKGGGGFKFDVKLAERALWLAGAAYCREGLGNWTCAYCVKGALAVRDVGVFEHEKKNVKAYAGYDTSMKRAVVSFRGTEPSSLENWMDNLDAMHAPLPEAKAKDGVGRVHSGFQDAYASVRKGLISHLIELRTKYDHMWRHFEVEITGQSLGGALSTLLAVELDALGFRVVRVTTFGSPRVGDWVFADYYAEKLGNQTYRMTHAHDAVPQLPPRVVGYHHVATEVFQNAAGEYIVGDGSGEDRSGSDSEWTHASLADHLTYLGLPVCDCNILER